jgi:tetratricopeptide (TPR) repeat protein
MENKYIEGEAKAHMGLGICEEKVLNIFNAKGSLESALERAVEGGTL